MDGMSPAIARTDEIGALGVFHLKRFWSRAMAQRSAGKPPADADAEWCADNTLVCGLNLGLHETMRHLFDEGPTFEEFEEWVLKLNGGAIPEERLARLNAALRGELPRHEPFEESLSAEDLAFFEEHGYVVLHDAAPSAVCAEAAEAVWNWVGGDPRRPETWYSGAQGHSIWVPLRRHPALNAIRGSARISAAFAQLWGRTDLWATVDQVGFNPPELRNWKFPGPLLHWDVSLELPIHFGLQGIVYLTDTEANQGAFTCVPGFHRKLENWLRELPPGAEPRSQDLYGLGAKPIEGRAGDLIIWHEALPHGSSPNRAARPRIVEYLTLRPTTWEFTSKWK